MLGPLLQPYPTTCNVQSPPPMLKGGSSPVQVLRVGEGLVPAALGLLLVPFKVLIMISKALNSWRSKCLRNPCQACPPVGRGLGDRGTREGSFCRGPCAVELPALGYMAGGNPAEVCVEAGSALVPGHSPALAGQLFPFLELGSPLPPSLQF